MENETENSSVQLLLEEAAAPAALEGNAPESSHNPPLGLAPDGFVLDIARATRTWIQYGMLGFAVACIVIGAVKGLLGL